MTHLGNICQACGETIPLGSPVVRVSVGTLGVTAHPHLKVINARTDYFHPTCDVAIMEVRS